LGQHNYFLLNPVQGSLSGRLTHWNTIVLLMRIPGFFRPGLVALLAGWVALMKTGGASLVLPLTDHTLFFIFNPPEIDFLSVSIIHKIFSKAA